MLCDVWLARGGFSIHPCLQPGPLVGLRNFHPSMIRWCLMHVVHLGLLFVCNGSGMNLAYSTSVHTEV